ncbi:hypothetical protein BC943DRAFT_357332 [Umbelopsis sp. AD052]|nr:hypothetical protein BC943DRAFT_357332 [Umbelopsis sp. AD052]
MSYPPTSDPESQQWFSRYDRGQKGHLTFDELHHLLNDRGHSLWAPFEQDTALKLARSFAPPGTQGPPTLTPPALNALWQYLSQWHSIFLSFDADRSGRISHSELQNALAAFGIRLPPRLVHLMIHKQNLMQGKIQKGRRLPDDIDFPSFIDLCITCKQATDTFGRLDPNHSGSVQLYWENYMDIIVSGR